MGNNIELGSEFSLSLNELCKTERNLFSYLQSYDTQYFNYGRSAIRQVPIPEGKTVLLPEFICESVTNCFPRDLIQFYRIDSEFQIDLDNLLSKVNDCTGTIYVVHYFGFLQDVYTMRTIRQIADDNQIVVVEDTTQSLFSSHSLCGDYALASIRKWMPVPMGGVLYSNSRRLPNPINFEQDQDNMRAYAMVLKELFLQNIYDTNIMYRRIFEQSEQNVDGSSEKKCLSDFAHFIIECVDVAQLQAKRKANAARLIQGLERLGISIIRKFSENECPLVVPLRVKDRDAFRRYLIENRIYCAVHWPFDGVLPEDRLMAQSNAKTLISLPIDQRYGENEIDYMCNVISQYGGDLLF